MNQQDSQILKDNAAYAAMSQMERRVSVSREVLRMMDAELFLPGRGYGSIIAARSAFGELIHADVPQGDLQPVLRKGGVECHGCAKAAALFARASIGNEVFVSLNESRGHVKGLADRVSQEVFGPAADLIEGLYERYTINSISMCSSTISNIARILGDAVPDYHATLFLLDNSPRERMRWIYRNIIDNGGYLVVGEHRF